MKKTGLFIFGILFMAFLIGTVSAAVDKTKAWHDAEHVLVTINSYTMSLQEAVDGGYLVDGANPPSQDGTTSVSSGHTGDKIWVSVDGSEMSLQDAISTTLCGSTPTTSYNNPKPNPGHYATEIEITIDGSEMSLQDAIDNGEFCRVSGTEGWSDWGEWSTCSASCGMQTRTRTCINPELGCDGDSIQSRECCVWVDTRDVTPNGYYLSTYDDFREWPVAVNWVCDAAGYSGYANDYECQLLQTIDYCEINSTCHCNPDITFLDARHNGEWVLVGGGCNCEEECTEECISWAEGCDAWGQGPWCHTADDTRSYKHFLKAVKCYR